MVMELKVPRGETVEALRPLVPVFLSYVLSFVCVGISWNNHHHLLQASTGVTGPMLWIRVQVSYEIPGLLCLDRPGRTVTSSAVFAVRW
jgi:hypothetical protein